MTSFKCRTCGSHWSEGITRDHVENQDCRHCEANNSDNLRVQLDECREALTFILDRADQNKDGRGIGWVYIGGKDYAAAREALDA